MFISNVAILAENSCFFDGKDHNGMSLWISLCSKADHDLVTDKSEAKGVFLVILVIAYSD